MNSYNLNRKIMKRIKQKANNDALEVYNNLKLKYQSTINTD